MIGPHWRRYPRTTHHPASPGAEPDDTIAADLSGLAGREFVVTEKMDGENATLYRDGFHARSLDSRGGPSRSRLAALHAAVAPLIPEGWRVCGEDLSWRHAIAYDGLPAPFLAFSIWTDTDLCLGWDDTLRLLQDMMLAPVPVVYRGPWSEDLLPRLALGLDLERQEGLVARPADAFLLSDFPRVVLKWVRANHVQADRHWRAGVLVPNGVRTP